MSVTHLLILYIVVLHVLGAVLLQRPNHFTRAQLIIVTMIWPIATIHALTTRITRGD